MIQRNVLLAPHTTFGVGGPAKYFAEAENSEELRVLCAWAKENLTDLPLDNRVFVLGGGSNVLVSDKGFGGLVVKNKAKNIEVKKRKIFADSGVLLSKVVQVAAGDNLSGMEWAVGIPGTVGGAVCGNSGSCGKQTADNLKYAQVLDLEKLSEKKFKKSDCDYYYRDSIFKRNKKLVVLEAVFELRKEKEEKIKEEMKYHLKERALTGGIGAKSAGCFFKNVDFKRKDINKKKLIQNFPELKIFSDKPKISAGFLIDFLGLKGKKMGDAVVSSSHANFILNSGKATADEIVMLIALVKNKIHSHYGFVLEEEVQLIGFD